MIDLDYDDIGSGEPVLFISGTGGAGRSWHLHQVPAFRAAGYRCITFDNRGIGNTEDAEGFGIQDMVADVVGIIEQLVGGPTMIVGMSMGAFIAQELMLARPDLVNKAVLMGTRGRIDAIRHAFRAAEYALTDSLTQSGIELPPAFTAKMRVLENFSPRTINNEKVITEWLEMFTAFPLKRTPGWRCQLTVIPQGNRLPAYQSITAPVLVIGFSDDVITPPGQGREVAAAIPKGRYIQIAHAGHLGFLERPETVNAAMLEFFAGTLV